MDKEEFQEKVGLLLRFREWVLVRWGKACEGIFPSRRWNTSVLEKVERNNGGHAWGPGAGWFP